MNGDDDSDLDEDIPGDDSDTDVFGEPTGVNVLAEASCARSFQDDMKKGQPFTKPVHVCPECGREMDRCAKCASGKVCTGEP